VYVPRYTAHLQRSNQSFLDRYLWVLIRTSGFTEVQHHRAQQIYHRYHLHCRVQRMLLPPVPQHHDAPLFHFTADVIDHNAHRYRLAHRPNPRLLPVPTSAGPTSVPGSSRLGGTAIGAIVGSIIAALMVLLCCLLALRWRRSRRRHRDGHDLLTPVPERHRHSRLYSFTDDSPQGQPVEPQVPVNRSGLAGQWFMLPRKIAPSPCRRRLDPRAR
jgi:hypothetical protein